MSTNDVPGANPRNGDDLKVGCWAEHEDGSLIFVEGTEGNRVVYSMFDFSKGGIVEYRDSMATVTFNKTFSWSGQKDGIKWTWHDKTPFPWDRVIKLGAQDGPRYASAQDIFSAAEKVARSLSLKGRVIDASDLSDRSDVTLDKTFKLLEKIYDAVEKLPDGPK